jgi:hypothetical protein
VVAIQNKGIMGRDEALNEYRARGFRNWKSK